MSSFCQSCGMPLEGNRELFGTEGDGSSNEDYCAYCYKDGKFTADVQMEGMIEICLPHLIAAHKGMTEEEGRAMMRGFLPKLKRWKVSPSREEMERKGGELLDKSFTVVLSSVTEEGYPRGCALVRIANDGFRRIYVSTGTSSKKTAHFRENPKAGICYADQKDGVTLIGTVRILGDDEKAPYWQDWMIEHFPLGAADPEFCVLEFSTREATLWIDSQFETYRY